MATSRSSAVRLPDGTRSVQSVWVWRALFFMSLIALGLCLAFATGGQLFYSGAWGFVAAGWFTTSMWLWRRHLQWDDQQTGRERSRRR